MYELLAFVKLGCLSSTIEAFFTKFSLPTYVPMTHFTVTNLGPIFECPCVLQIEQKIGSASAFLVIDQPMTNFMIPSAFACLTNVCRGRY